MRILVLGDHTQDTGALESAIPSGAIEVVSVEDTSYQRTYETRYAFGKWTLDPVTRELVDTRGERVQLTSSEFDLLLALVRAPGRTRSRSELVNALRGRDWTYFDRSIDTLVARLRKKIEAKGGTSLIRSVRGIGYVFCAHVSRACESEAAPA
jgi:DNA-binding response OmpR family regulator